MVSSPRPSGNSSATTRVGVALSAMELCVSVGLDAAARAHRMPLERMDGDDGEATWPALTHAFREIARQAGRGTTISVCLMDTLAEVRQLALPPMRAADLQLLLTRNAARYFLNARSPQVIGALNGDRRPASAAHTLVAAAASQRLVSAIHNAARETGVSVECIVSSPGACAAAAVKIWPTLARGRGRVAVMHSDSTDLLELRDGRLAGIRRFRPGAADESLLAAALGDTPAGQRARGAAPVMLLGAADRRNALERSLGQRGIKVVGVPPQWLEQASAIDVLAATFGGPLAGPLLENDDLRAARRTATSVVLRWAASAAVTLLFAVALFEWWGQRRELNALQAQRSALRSQVAATLVGRTSVETALRQLATLNAQHRTAPRWAATLAGLGSSLDQDTYLTSFRGHGDSVVIDGLATHAAAAFDAVEKTAGLTGVRAAAPVRREAPSDGPAMERFTIAARLAPRGKP